MFDIGDTFFTNHNTKMVINLAAMDEFGFNLHPTAISYVIEYNI